MSRTWWKGYEEGGEEEEDEGEECLGGRATLGTRVASLNDRGNHQTLTTV